MVGRCRSKWWDVALRLVVAIAAEHDVSTIEGRHDVVATQSTDDIGSSGATDAIRVFLLRAEAGDNAVVSDPFVFWNFVLVNELESFVANGTSGGRP